MQNIPLKFFISRCKEMNWEVETFLKILKAGNAMISILDCDAFDRWQKHQKFNYLMHRLRAIALDIDLVVGFFPHGTAQEISLWGDEFYTEERKDVPYSKSYAPIWSRGDTDHEEFPTNGFIRSDPTWYSDDRIQNLIIGQGCRDLIVKVKAQWNLLRSYDWGWEDPMGQHIQKYDSDSRTYTRESMTGRHHYCLKILENGEVSCSPMNDDEIDEEIYEENPAKSELDKLLEEVA